MILCENGPDGLPVLFDGAEDLVVAWTLAEVAPALHRLDRARADGFWIAGYAAYEAGFAFEPRLADLPFDGPLLVFGIYAGPRAAPQVQGRGRLHDLRPAIARADYATMMAVVKAYIAAGDCYQANLTFPMTARLEGTPLGLYANLRDAQPVGFGAYLDMGIGPTIISRSPELFFAVDDAGGIEAKPMKGTAPRDPDPARDAALAEGLRTSEKDRAENLMIVDLLRNDISRIARVGSVRVPELFAVEPFATVHQMSSRVIGQLDGHPGIAGLFAALFPCGSITGAPKLRAMQIIAEVERQPRGVYCGAIGWMAPSGRAAFNVAIRTLQVTGTDVRLNVGGGIVQDSTESGEWEEALWKARYTRLA